MGKSDRKVSTLSFHQYILVETLLNVLDMQALHIILLLILLALLKLFARVFGELLCLY